LLSLLLLSALSQGAPLGKIGVSVPLHALKPCVDPRFPALAGPWILGCSKNGAVDLAISLSSGKKIKLPSSISPGTRSGHIYSPELGHVDFSSPGEAKPSAFERDRFGDRTAPPAIGGAGIAVANAQTLRVLPTDSRVIQTMAAEDLPLPLGWQPPALAGQRVAWSVDAGPDGTDLWWAPLSGGRPELLDGGPGNQHHPVGQGHWLAWIGPAGVTILDTRSAVKVLHPAQTGFSAGLTLWQGVACWETRSGPDLDIQCSDGQVMDGTGHQHHPSRWEQWLLYRQDGHAWLTVLEGA
jgi:hypothetical protein